MYREQMGSLFASLDMQFEKSAIAFSSGSTATIVQIDPEEGRLGVAWVGDSRAIVGGSSYGSKGLVSVKTLTTDHTAWSVSEGWRIHAAGGEIKELWSKGSIHKYAYYRGEDYPGISVTRAFGDFSGKQSSKLISHLPDVTLHTFNPSDQVVIVASDGLWDKVSNAQAVGIALEFKDNWDAKAD